MVLNMAGKPDVNISKAVVVVGNSVAAIQAALTLAQMGVEVKLITKLAAFGYDDITNNVLGASPLDQRFLWPLLVRATSHPSIKLYTGAEVVSVGGGKGDFKIQVVQRPRYIHEDLCTGCGRCQAECSVSVTSLLRGQKITHSAIHTPLLDTKAIPSAYVIDKNRLPPCRVACPLGINVQGFVSLLANSKPDKALTLINEEAPLAGILGRVCTHPCEDNCNRAQVDSPVYIRALHRYAADNATEGIKYSRRFPARSREGKIAIVGSGPAGLTAAWELTRLGYSPVVFESHGVIGGMLATGIPRFRLPREVREREIEAIRNMGIDIRTGITVGRDVTFAYLKERGYRAFFLSIGAQRNNKLNISGEELEGVEDCMPLLLALNLKVDTFVGSNVVVIGGGNAAIDAARAVFRSGAEEVTIFYRRTRAEMPAISEEVEEAIREGVKIEFLTIPVEILGDRGRVTGISCQRTRLSSEIMTKGKREPKPIPGTDFVVDADHVVVAIGQSPNAQQLNMGSLAVDRNIGVIRVNPITLETSIPGVFAGGDCVTGPNNVVEAMAAGLRAAESIHRYMQGQDLEMGRSLEPPQVADIDLKTIEVSPYKRANMPVVHFRKRTSSFEETTKGLSARMAQREAQRCLNCALCSQCMECTRVCELDAVFHDDDVRHFELEAQDVLRFPSGNSKENATIGEWDQEAITECVHMVFPGGNGELADEVVKAMAIAMETALEIKPREIGRISIQNFEGQQIDLGRSHLASEQTANRMERIGVFLCRCGDSISSVIDFKTVARKLSRLPKVACVREIGQACTKAGAEEIANQAADSQLDRVVLAACRCCSSEQVCYSCTDRRMMCQQYLNQYLTPLDRYEVEWKQPISTRPNPQPSLCGKGRVEFVNIREQCAWVHRDNPKGATRKAVQMISAGIERAGIVTSIPLDEKSILPSALIIGGGLVNITAAKALVSQGYQVELVDRKGLIEEQREHSEISPSALDKSQEKAITIRQWPDVLRFGGSPGNYEALMEYGSHVDCITAGAVLVNMEELIKNASYLLDTTSRDGLLSRIVARTSNSSHPLSIWDNILREITIKETAGIFLLPPNGDKLPEEKILQGLAVAAQVSTYLEQVTVSPRAMAINIDTKLCRGCGNCADICSYIEMQENADGTVYACIDRILCLGCGACVSSCPTGALTQLLQSDKQIISTLRSMLRRGQVLSEV